MTKKRIVWLVVAVVVIVAALVGYRTFRARKNGALHFETAKVDRGRVIAKVTASGSLSAIVTVQVGSQVSGRLQKILVDFNSPVTKGQLIAKIDPQLIEATYQQARANLVAAQGNLAKAKVQALDADRQLKRSASLAERKLIAQADLDTAQANADAAKAQVDVAAGQVEQSKASLNQAQVNLNYTDIFSPTDGVVISRNVDVGQTVAASLQAPTLFVIAEDLRKMQVDTWVAEADIGKLQPGMPAMFTVDAYPGERFRGKVRQIRNAPQTQQNVVTYDAVIDIDNSELKLKPGMTANVTFIWAQRDDVLRLPNAALRFKAPAELTGSTGAAPARTGGAAASGQGGGAGGRPGGGSPGGGWNRGEGGGPRAAQDKKPVWVLADGTPKQVSIKTGVTDGSFTEIVEGELKEGDPVITDASGGTAATQQTPAGTFPRRMF
jgi:HlyD family secretion protein